MKFLYNKGFLQNFAAITIAILLIVGASIINLSRPELVYATSCSVYDGNQGSCSGTTGCLWNDSCSTFNGNQGTCEATNGCSYPANGGDCSILDAGTCSVYSGSGCTVNNGNCSWDGASCSGGNPGVCDQIADEGTCTSSTYFTGCSGSYDNGTCAGTMTSGLCTGDFDNTAPIISIVTPISTPTNDTTPSYTFTTDEAGTMNYSGCEGDLVSATYGNNTVTLTAFQYNTYGLGPHDNCTIWVTDVANNQGMSVNIPSFTFDLTAPTTSGTPDMTSGTDFGSSNNDNITNDNTPTFTGACTSGNTVQLYVDGASTGSSGSCSSNTFTLTTGPLASGDQSITFKETDPAGNVSDPSSSLSISIHINTPVLSEVTTVPTYTNDTTPNYTFTVDEAGTITYGGSCSSGTTSASSGNNTITFNTLAEGAYSDCTVTVTDVAGNLGELAVTLFTIDTTAPTITSVSSDKAAGAYTVGEVIDIDVTFSEGVFSTGNVTVTLETGTTDRTCTFTIGGTSDGTCNYTVQTGDTTSDLTVSSISGTIADAASNAMSNFTPVTNLAANEALVIDTTAPVTSGAPDMTSGTDSGTNSDDITNDNTPTFTGSCTDGNTVQLFDDGVSSGSSATCASSVFSLTTGTLATGSNSITFKETDTVGNVSSASTALVVTIDITSPTISESGAIATATDTTPDYTFTTSEAGTISYGGSCSSVTTSASSGSNTITFTTLAVGTYIDCTVIVIDTASNASNTLTLTSFTITAPASDSEPEVQANNNISGSSPSRLNTIVTTTPPTNTPSNPPCSSGERFNTNTGLPCGNSTPPEVPGCAFGFNFSILTGKSCNTSPISPQTPSTPNIPNTPSTYKFLKDIPFGTIRSDDARQLQIFLNTHNFPVALTGVGSLGRETRYFGPATRTALAKFQAFAGITPALGFFGPITRNYINGL